MMVSSCALRAVEDEALRVGSDSEGTVHTRLPLVGLRKHFTLDMGAVAMWTVILKK